MAHPMFCASALAAFVATFTTSSTRADEKTVRGKDEMVSGGKKVRVERFEPAAEGKYPAVIFLAGLDGLHPQAEEIHRQIADHFARRGYVVLVVRYFDRTGTQATKSAALLKGFREILNDRREGNPRQEALLQDFAAWMQVVRDALKHARNLPNVDGRRVALVGLSLGGFLASTVAAEPGQRVAAVATLFGGGPGDAERNLWQFPPALILTGDRDEVVPPRKSELLRDLLRQRKIAPTKFHLYPGVGHGFGINLSAAQDAERRVAKFLRAHLGNDQRPIPPCAARGSIHRCER